MILQSHHITIVLAGLGSLLIDDWLTYNMDGLKDTIGGATL